MKPVHCASAKQHGTPETHLLKIIVYINLLGEEFDYKLLHIRSTIGTCIIGQAMKKDSEIKNTFITFLCNTFFKTAATLRRNKFLLLTVITIKPYSPKITANTEAFWNIFKLVDYFSSC